MMTLNCLLSAGGQLLDEIVVARKLLLLKCLELLGLRDVLLRGVDLTVVQGS